MFFTGEGDVGLKGFDSVKLLADVTTGDFGGELVTVFTEELF